VLCCLAVALQEDGALSARVAKYGTKSWTTIASGVEGRSAVSSQQLQSLLSVPVAAHAAPAMHVHAGSCLWPSLSRHVAWSTTPSDCSCFAVTALLLRHFPPFCALPQQKSCRLRWYNQLCPGVKRTPFSEWEQAVIIKVRTVLAWGFRPAGLCWHAGLQHSDAQKLPAASGPVSFYAHLRNVHLGSLHVLTP
jgi:hypothetical protein